MSVETLGGYEISDRCCDHGDCGKDAQFKGVLADWVEPKYWCAEHKPEALEGVTVSPLITGIKIIPKDEPKTDLKPLEFTDPDTGMVENVAPGDLRDFIGKTLTMMDGERVKVEHIVGSAIRETRFEVNGKHHIVILDAFKQLHNDKSITQAQIDKFDQLEVERIIRVKDDSGPTATRQLPRLDVQ